MRAPLLRWMMKSLLLAGFFISTGTGAQAGAWTQPEGKGQVIVNASYYSTDARFDTRGRSVPQTTYSKQELNPYIEYGLTPQWTLGANAFFLRADDSTRSHTGIGDTELFARRQLLRNERYALALQPLIKLPAPSDTSAPTLGSRNPDLGLSLIGGMNFPLFGRMHFAEAEMAYRYRFGAPRDQIVLNATLGLSLTPRFTLMPQLFQTLRAQTAAVTSFTQSPRDDYNLTKAQLSALYQLTDTHTLQLGAFRHVAGENAGKGGGVLLSVWSRF